MLRYTLKLLAVSHGFHTVASGQSKTLINSIEVNGACLVTMQGSNLVGDENLECNVIGNSLNVNCVDSVSGGETGGCSITSGGGVVCTGISGSMSSVRVGGRNIVLGSGGIGVSVINGVTYINGKRIDQLDHLDQQEPSGDPKKERGKKEWNFDDYDMQVNKIDTHGATTLFFRDDKVIEKTVTIDTSGNSAVTLPTTEFDTVMGSSSGNSFIDFGDSTVGHLVFSASGNSNVANFVVSDMLNLATSGNSHVHGNVHRNTKVAKSISGNSECSISYA